MQAPNSSSAIIERMAALSRAEMQALQLQKLQRQVARLYESSGFYRERWEAAGVRPEDIRSLADLRRLPTMTKADCMADQAAHPPFGRRLGIAREDVALVCMTGGTSGQGQEVYGRSAHDLFMQGYFHQLPWHIVGLRQGDIALNCVPSGGLTTGGWGPTEGFRAAGALPLTVGGTMSTDAKIDLMCRFGEVHFIYASTNYLHTLTEALRRRGIDPRKQFPMMKALFIAAEGYPIEWALQVQEFWGAKLHEGYGSTQGAGFICATSEQGVVATDGSRAPMQCFDWHVIVEVLDPETDEPVGEGEYGEVVLTNLDIEGSAVIRFRTRDRVRLLPLASAGNGRAWTCIESGTIGRYDDMMKIRGNNVWPSAVDLAVFAHHEVAEYIGSVFVDERGRTEVLVKIGFKPEHAAASEEVRAATLKRIQAAIKERTNVQMTIVDVPRDELPFFENKARRWKDERPVGYQLSGGAA
jgi:phenylacetate-CoA ligase